MATAAVMSLRLQSEPMRSSDSLDPVQWDGGGCQCGAARAMERKAQKLRRRMLLADADRIGPGQLSIAGLHAGLHGSPAVAGAVPAGRPVGG
jgi:hypothetical protein